MRLPRTLVLFLLVTNGGPVLLPPRASGWQRTLPEISGLLGFGGDVGESLDVALLGDDVVAGFVSDAGTGSDAAFVKLSGTDGSEMWRQTIDGAGYADDAFAVKLDPFGDVIGAASLVTSPGTASVSTVVKLAGGTGS